jgi:Flp pilus assembly protein TadD
MCQWVQGYGLDPADFRSVVATFASVFPEVSLWEESTSGGDYLMLGSNESIRIDTASLTESMRSSGVAADLARVEVDDPAALLVHFVSGNEEVRKLVRGAAIQTQDRLQLEHTAPRALRTETLGGILAILEPHRPRSRTLPATLGIDDRDLAIRLAALAGEWRREREWAEGLGLTAGEQGDPAVLRAISYLRAGMRARALEESRELVRRKPLERLPRILLAHLSMSMGIVDQSVEQLSAALALDPDDFRLRLFLSRALFVSGDLRTALLHNVEASRLEPGSAEAANDRCAMFLSVDDFASAEAACRDAVSLDPELAQAHSNLGLVHLRRARTMEAEREYGRALELDPTLIDARYNLALLLQREGRPGEGLMILDQALSMPGADAEVLRLAGELAHETGDREKARRYEAEGELIDRGH